MELRVKGGRIGLGLDHILVGELERAFEIENLFIAILR